jgi:hypothetical protein
MNATLRLSLPAALFSAAFGIFFTSSAAERTEELARMLPATSTVVVVIKNNPELIKDWDASGIGRFLEDADAKKWMAPLYDSDGELKWTKEMRESEGSSFREGIIINPGATVVGFDFSAMMDDESDEPTIVEISEMAGREKELEAALTRRMEAKKKVNPKAVVKTVDVAGNKATVLAEDDSDEAAWLEGSVIVDGLQIATKDQELMESVIGSVKSGGDATKIAEQLTQVAELNAGPSDMTIMADAEQLVGMLKKKLMESAADAKQPSPFNPAMFLAAFGLEELKTMAMTLDFSEERSSGGFVLLHTPKPTGILPALLRGSSNEVPQLAFLPASADQASVSRQSFGNIYDTLMAAVQKLGPLSGMLTMQLDEMEKKAGMSLRKDLFGSLDDVIAQAQTMKAAQGAPVVSQVSAIKLKDKARFQAALDAVIAMVGNGFGVFEETEIEGVKVHTFKSSLSPNVAGPGKTQKSAQFCYAVTDEYFLFCQGEQDMLRTVIGRLSSKATDGSIWELPASQSALAMLPQGYTGMSVSKGASIMKTMADIVTQVQAMSAMGRGKPAASAKGPKSKGPQKPDKEGGAAPAADQWFVPSAVPGEDVFARYFSVTAVGNYAEPEATAFRFFALPATAK